MRVAAVAIASVFVVAAGCASAQDAPRGVQAEPGFPSLRDVPRTVDANTDPTHWQAVERELMAAGRALRENPRAAAPSQSDDPAAFLEQARRDLDQTRQAREP